MRDVIDHAEERNVYENSQLSLNSSRHLNVLGIRGVPANHGGFETFAEHLASYLVGCGWVVTVYCQEGRDPDRPTKWVDSWNGINRIHIQTRSSGALATVEFDALSVLDVLHRPGIDLVLGYNTAGFNVLQRIFGRPVVMNMDEIEWKRRKWRGLAKGWFWINEWIGARSCTIAIADHPEIAAHLKRRGRSEVETIPYGADSVISASPEPVRALGLETEEYFLSIARIEPENSILEIVQAFGEAKTGKKLVVLGRLTPEINKYHGAIKAAACNGVIFPGAIYSPTVVQSLRYHCLAYMHGHQVGGTNPSLVEALGAGSPVVAHNNQFNLWTTNSLQLYFSNVSECADHMRLLSKRPDLRAEFSAASRRRHAECFTYAKIHAAYREILERQLDIGILKSMESRL